MPQNTFPERFQMPELFFYDEFQSILGNGEQREITEKYRFLQAIHIPFHE